MLQIYSLFKHVLCFSTSLENNKNPFLKKWVPYLYIRHLGYEELKFYACSTTCWPPLQGPVFILPDHCVAAATQKKLSV